MRSNASCICIVCSVRGRVGDLGGRSSRWRGLRIFRSFGRRSDNLGLRSEFLDVLLGILGDRFRDIIRDFCIWEGALNRVLSAVRPQPSLDDLFLFLWPVKAFETVLKRPYKTSVEHQHSQ